MPRGVAAAWLAALLLPLCCDPALSQPLLRATQPLVEWRFQPGRPGTAPHAGDWVPVRLPDLWTAPWAHPRAAAGTSWAEQDLRDAKSAWYEADVPIPAEWEGRRVLLDLHGVQCDAIIWVDGRRIAEVQGPEARADLTGLPCRAGRRASASGSRAGGRAQRTGESTTPSATS